MRSYDLAQWGIYAFLVAPATKFIYKYIMKINEVTKTNRQSLFEELDSDNKTGFPTETLVSVVEAHQADVWEELTDESWETMKKSLSFN